MAAQSGDSTPIARTDPSTDRAVPMASPTPMRTHQNHPAPSNEDTVNTPDESPSASSTPSSSPLSGPSSSSSCSQSSSSTGEDRAITSALKCLAEELDSIDNGRPKNKARVAPFEEDAPQTLSKHLPSPDSPDSSASNIARTVVPDVSDIFETVLQASLPGFLSDVNGNSTTKSGRSATALSIGTKAEPGIKPDPVKVEQGIKRETGLYMEQALEEMHNALSLPLVHRVALILMARLSPPLGIQAWFHPTPRRVFTPSSPSPAVPPYRGSRSSRENGFDFIDLTSGTQDDPLVISDSEDSDVE
ncbi:hypothetical protein FCOIX_9425 [Fusarium coicis]|nr:hypothetical protein FCOIX_9425 [Fusarium coicis]